MRNKILPLISGLFTFALCLQLVTLGSFAQCTKLLEFDGTANGGDPRGSLLGGNPGGFVSTTSTSSAK